MIKTTKMFSFRTKKIKESYNKSSEKNKNKNKLRETKEKLTYSLRKWGFKRLEMNEIGAIWSVMQKYICNKVKIKWRTMILEKLCTTLNQIIKLQLSKTLTLALYLRKSENLLILMLISNLYRKKANHFFETKLRY